MTAALHPQRRPRPADGRAVLPPALPATLTGAFSSSSVYFAHRPLPPLPLLPPPSLPPVAHRRRPPWPRPPPPPGATLLPPRSSCAGFILKVSGTRRPAGRAGGSEERRARRAVGRADGSEESTAGCGACGWE
eukprot:350571-Chlamydomonas_euryale.AAC.3